MQKSTGKKLQKFLSVAIILFFIIGLLPQTALAASTHDIGDGFTVDLANSTIYPSSGVFFPTLFPLSEGDTLNILEGASVTLTGTTDVPIQITCEAGVTLTLEDVTIDVSGTSNACALSFTGSGNTLILSGENALSSGRNEPGVRVESGTALEIKGAGSVNATGGEWAAGIGGGNGDDGGTITIKGGTVTATGRFGAGIGGGDRGGGGTITIESGTVTATGGENSAGIGGGPYEDGGTINISGGTVTATGGDSAAGIGGGDEGDGGTITIESGDVTATGGYLGAGIGGGHLAYGGTITIESGTVTATGGEDGAGIGGGAQRDGGTTTISGGTVTAKGGNYGAGIGGGIYHDGGTITISGGTVTATGGYEGAGIGGGDDGDGGTITIESGDVTATGGYLGAGIGGGYYGIGGTITIESGTVTAKGGDSAAGIGGGASGDGGTITIESGTVTATGGNYGAGIGGGYYGFGGTITISGGTVYAARGTSGKDIGPGVSASSGTFTLYGDALVFLENDSCLAPVTDTHKHFSKSGLLYGFSLPNGWSDAGIYATVYTITYNDNGGTGGKNVVVPQDGTGTTLSESGLSKPGYSLKEWNTEANGNGTSYTPGDSITMTEDITLYAIWEADDASMISNVTPSECGAALDGDIVITFANDMDETADGTVTVGGETLADGTWSSSNRVYTISYSVELFNTEYPIDISGFKDTYGAAMNSTSYSFTTEAPAELKSLSVDTGTLTFDADTVVYTVNATGINSIGITAETEDPDATLTINGVSATSGTETTVNLNNGANLIPVVVTSQDGTQKSYIISVNGTVSNAELGSLSIGSDAQTVGSSSFTASVGSDVTSVDIEASPSDSKAIMLLEGAILTSGVSKSVDLSVGENIFTLMVIAQDATTKSYTVIVNRGSSDATLSGLTLSDGTVSPSFNRTTYAYTASVANAVDSLTVSPTAFDNAATVTVNGADAATPVSLSVGSNTVTVLVTGADGVSTKAYTITVTRQAEITITNASLPVSIVNGFYSVTMTAEGGDDAFTWSAAGLPASNNLSIDSATGVLSGTPAEVDEGTYTVTITATDGNGVTGDKSYTLVVQKGCGGGAYLIVSDGDAAYTGSYTDDGIPTLTVNDGVSGFTYFRVDISAVTGNAGTEVCVFVHTRGGVQVGFSFNEADYDTVGLSGAAFNVKAGDVIEVFIVDTLSNGSGSASTVL